MRIATLLMSTLLLASSHVLAVEESQQGALRSEDDGYAIFLLVRSTNDWLALSPQQRFGFLDKDVQPLLAAHPKVTMKFWDTEHFSSRVTDVILLQTQDLGQYRSLVEGLRESKFWGHYFEVVDILPGIENAYADHYGVKPYGDQR